MIWHLALPLLRKNNRLRHGFEKRVTTGHLNPADIWIQAASAGEAYLAVKLIKALNPHQPVSILITSITLQGLEILKAHLEAADLDPNIDLTIEWFPFDMPTVIQKAVNRVRPATMVLLETELWPALLYSLKESGSTILMVNARMTRNSFKGYMRTRFLWKHLEPDQILATSKQDKDRYARLFPSATVRTMANIKFNEMGESPDTAEQDSHFRRLLPPDRPVVLLASIRKQEEPLCLDLITKLIHQRPDIRIAVFPRHLHRIKSWKKRLSSHEIAFRLRTEDQPVPDETRLILWDRFGELNTAYQFARVVFVGGSLKPLGGQNFIEPVLAGAQTVIGPHYDDFNWVGEQIFEKRLVCRTQTVEETAQAMISALNKSHDKNRLINRCKTYIRTRQGGVQTACDEILKTL